MPTKKAVNGKSVAEVPVSIERAEVRARWRALMLPVGLAKEALSRHDLNNWEVFLGNNTNIDWPTKGKDGGTLKLSANMVREPGATAFNHIVHNVSVAVEGALLRERGEGFDDYRVAGRAYHMGSTHVETIAYLRKALAKLRFRAYLKADGENAISSLLRDIDAGKHGPKSSGPSAAICLAFADRPPAVQKDCAREMARLIKATQYV